MSNKALEKWWFEELWRPNIGSLREWSETRAVKPHEDQPQAVDGVP